MKPKIHKPSIQLAKTTETNRIKSVLIELALQAQNLTKKDIGTWRAAWQMAINPENPQRARLYEVYTDVAIDLHLSGAIDQRKGMVLRKSFKVVDNKGKELPELSSLLMSDWFKQFANLVLDSRYWGHSLIQFGDIVKTGDKLRFESVELVPRRHVIPEFGVFVREVGQEATKGISYRTGPLSEWCIEAGQKSDLGLLLKVAPQVLAKKNMLAFWDEFGELFGMPIRIGKTTSRDNKEINKIEQMLSGMGAAAWGLFPEGTDIDIKESTRGDAYNVYDKRIDRANNEISKGILNQTMTIDNGSSLSQSEVHLQVFENVVRADADFLRDMINDRLIPFLINHGFPFQNATFNYDESIDYTPEQQVSIDEMLINNFDIDPKYFAEKYNVPITGKKVVTPSNFFA